MAQTYSYLVASQIAPRYLAGIGNMSLTPNVTNHQQELYEPTKIDTDGRR